MFDLANILSSKILSASKFLLTGNKPCVLIHFPLESGTKLKQGIIKSVDLLSANYLSALLDFFQWVSDERQYQHSKR